jgi:O-succinylbenzoate synthase
VADAARLRALDAADAVVLKVQPLGGVRAALAVAAAAGVPAIPTSMMETSVGVAAGLALAAALPELVYACGLATVEHLGADVTHDPLVPIDGRLRVRAVTPDADLLERYSARSSAGSSVAGSSAPGVTSASHVTTAPATSSGRSRWTA